MVENEEIRFTGMGFSVGSDRILTYRPTWEGGHPAGAEIVSIPQRSVDTARDTGKAPTAELPSLDAVVNAMFHLQQGQRHLTSPFASPYIDKPIKTFFVKGWFATASLEQRILMADAAMFNYALGLSRGQTMGLIERTYREIRHLVADFSMMAAKTSAAIQGGHVPEGDLLTEQERETLSKALSDPDRNLLWVIGIGWLCCWHDHMATKKDFSSGILKTWFSQVESPLKVTSTIGWDDFLRPVTIERVRDIGTQCLQSCWVISDEDGEVIDVLADEAAWDAMFAREREPKVEELTLDRITAEMRADLDALAEGDEEPDDIIPESMMSLKRDIDMMTPQDIIEEDE